MIKNFPDIKDRRPDLEERMAELVADFPQSEKATGLAVRDLWEKMLDSSERLSRAEHESVPNYSEILDAELTDQLVAEFEGIVEETRALLSMVLADPEYLFTNFEQGGVGNQVIQWLQRIGKLRDTPVAALSSYYQNANGVGRESIEMAMFERLSRRAERPMTQLERALEVEKELRAEIETDGIDSAKLLKLIFVLMKINYDCFGNQKLMMLLAEQSMWEGFVPDCVLGETREQVGKTMMEFTEEGIRLVEKIVGVLASLKG